MANAEFHGMGLHPAFGLLSQARERRRGKRSGLPSLEFANSQLLFPMFGMLEGFVTSGSSRCLFPSLSALIVTSHIANDIECFAHFLLASQRK